MSGSWTTARRRALGFAARSPRVWRRLVLRSSPEGGVAGPGTDLVIEGYPSSANSYALTAFRWANPGAVTASHQHDPRHLRIAARYRVPVLFLVRSPLDAVASYLRRFSSPDQAAPELARWRSLGRVALDLDSARVCIVPFERVTSDLGAVIDEANVHFGRRFASLAPSSELDTRIFEAIEAHDLAVRGPVSRSRVGRPDRGIAGDGDRFRAAVAEHDALVAACEGMYAQLLERAGRQAIDAS